jgi:hypothetical protein
MKAAFRFMPDEQSHLARTTGICEGRTKGFLDAAPLAVGKHRVT